MPMNLENVFIQLPNFFFIKDLNSEYRVCNQHFANSVGLNKTKDVIGLSDFDLPWPDSHAKLYREGDQEVLNSQPRINILEPLRKLNGDITTIQVTKAPLLNKKGDMIGIICGYTEHIPEVFCGKFDPEKSNISLSKEQGDILYYVALGMKTHDIADKLELTLREMDMRLQSLQIKLRCKNLTALIEKAISIGFVRRRLLRCERHSCHDNIQFSPRESAILKLIIRGKTAKETARALYLSPRTVENYLAGIKNKIGAKNKSELIEKILDMDLF